MSASSPPPARRSSLPSLTARVRGRYMKTFAEHVERLPELDRRHVSAEVPTAFFREIAESGTFAWLPFEYNLVLTRAVAAALGTRRTHEFFVSLMRASFETPLLKGLVEAVLRLKGNDPSVMLQWVSRGFELMFKDAGAWSVVERKVGAASMEVSGLPAAAVRDRVWLESVASALSALYLLAHVRGVTVIRDVDVERGRAEFRLRWA